MPFWTATELQKIRFLFSQNKGYVEMVFAIRFSQNNIRSTFLKRNIIWRTCFATESVDDTQYNLKNIASDW